MTHPEDPHDLNRFLEAQVSDYVKALGELRRGRKTSHWIWYIFPQMDLGSSQMAKHYAIRSKDEASAYLAHPVLGPRLMESAEALLQHWGESIETIMGFPDHLKLNSSMTLFAAISPPNSVFEQVLDVFYRGQKDRRTLHFIENHPS
jgi:uncharacterized protein (DUF1810 family)